MTARNLASSPDTIPPIVLLLESDPDTLEMYAWSFKKAGVWVAGLDAPGTALDAAKELRPDAIVTDTSALGPDAVAVVNTLKHDAATAHIPLIVLLDGSADDLPSAARSAADLVLTKPVMPAALLDGIREIIVRSHELRSVSVGATTKARRLVARSQRLVGRSSEISAALDAGERRCPSCHRRLEWIADRSGQTQYDYYRWCRTGCGLFCYDRASDAERGWIKLA